MKDTARRAISFLLPIGGLSILAWYTQHHVTIIQSARVSQQRAILGVFAVILLAFLLQFGIVMFPGKWLKLRAVAMGLLLIIASHFFLIDNAQAGIYAGDLMTVIGLLMLFLSLA